MSPHNHKHDADGPFSDVHCSQHGNALRVGVTLTVSPLSFEGVLAGMGMDASSSLTAAYGRGGFLWKTPNLVDKAMHALWDYLQTVDADHDLFAAYWAAGDGSQIIQAGHAIELTAEQVQDMTFEGPRDLGRQTMVFPILKAFVDHALARKAAGETVTKAILVIITDGEFHDYPKVLEYTQFLAGKIASGEYPQIIFSVVGVGDGVKEEQLETLMHDTFDGEEHEIWCYNLAAEMDADDLARVVAHLVDSKIIAYKNGAVVLDDQGNELRRFETDVPAHFEFEMSHNSSNFTLSLGGQNYTLSVEDLEHEGEDHDGDHDDDHDADHEPAGHHAH